MKYIAAVSGGPDSMAMLYKYKDLIDVVCSVDYNKRENSYLDNLIVEDFCKQNNIKFELLKVTNQIYDEYNVNNFQDKARQIRYDFFLKIAKKYNNFNLLVAHNKSDWMETAYMQKESSSKSLYYGIRKKSKYKELSIYRPLIKIYKNKLEDFCNKNNIKYAIDYTNNTNLYVRNKIRKEMKEWSFIKKNSFNLSIHFFNIRNHSLDKKVLSLFNKWLLTNFDFYYLKNIKNKKIKYYLIYNFLSHYDERNNSSNKIENIMSFLNNKTCKRYRLENQRHIQIENDKIIIVKDEGE